MVFRAIGDSMGDAGIRHDDILYVKPVSDSRSANGRIVVCKLEGALFIGKLVTTGRGIRLEAGHGQSIDPDTAPFELLGVVVAHLGAL